MLFNSLQFVVFFVFACAAYWTLPARWRTHFLLAASYVFYGSWDYRFLSLILISTAVDYFAALRVHESRDPRRRRAFLLLSVGTNLGILGFFKYCNFFLDTFAALLSRLGFETHLGTLAIVLPVGISFYTFQTMSYTIDVYRRQAEPSRDFVSFATFVAFFPQLVAGPIERFGSLYPQIAGGGRLSAELWRKGFFLLLQGYTKKVAIADNLAPRVDAVFAAPASFGSGELLEAAILFTLQIYCDFSGYSDIARGTANLLGIELVENFRAPLLSRSITEFWRRWHVSLSQWLRDYLYIALGGNRRGASRTYANLMATMLLGGLWHGADWKFVVWGGLHGLLLAVERAIGVRAPRSDLPQALSLRLSACVAWAATFAAVVAIFVFFRAESIDSAAAILAGIAELRSLGDVLTSRLLYAALAITLMDVPLLTSADQTWLLGWPTPLRVVLYAAMLVAIVVLSGGTTQTFIYFAF